MTVSVRRLDTQDRDFDSQLDALLAWDPDAQSGAAADSVRSAVAATLSRVRAEGDAAVLDLTARFDDFAPKDMAAVRISADELAQAFAGLPEAERDALQLALEVLSFYGPLTREEITDLLPSVPEDLFAQNEFARFKFFLNRERQAVGGLFERLQDLIQDQLEARRQLTASPRAATTRTTCAATSRSRTCSRSGITTSTASSARA